MATQKYKMAMGARDYGKHLINKAVRANNPHKLNEAYKWNKQHATAMTK